MTVEINKVEVEKNGDPYDDLLNEIDILARKLGKKYELDLYKCLTIATKIVMDNALNYTLFEISGAADNEQKE